jgi:hypothetical protein
MDHIRRFRRINLTQAKADMVRECQRLGLRLLVFGGISDPPIHAWEDPEAAVARIYEMHGRCRVSVQYGQEAATVGICMGTHMMEDSVRLLEPMTLAYQKLGGLPATVSWRVLQDGFEYSRVYVFRVPSNMRLASEVKIADGVCGFGFHYSQIAPYQRVYHHMENYEFENRAELIHMPEMLPMLPPAWLKLMKAPRLKTGGKWYAFNSVDAAERAIIARQALRRVSDLLAEILPGGGTFGSEYVARNPNREDHQAGSFRINMDSGRWADFAMPGVKGEDLIGLTAYVKGCDYQVAAAWIANKRNKE